MADEKQEVLTVFRVDVAEFKRNIQDATASMRKADAQFAATTAEMDDFEKSSEGLEAKIKQLAATTEAQNKIWDTYKKQLAATREAKEKNIKQAEDLRKTLANLEKAGKKSGDEFKDLAKQLAKMEKEIAKAEKAEADLETKMLKAEAAAKKSAKEMDDYGKKLKSVEKNSSGLRGFLNKVKESLDDSGDAAEDASDGFTVFKGTLANLASDAVLKGLDLIADGVRSITEGLVDACSAADQLQTATNNFSTQTGLNTKENPEYENAIRNLYSQNYGDDYSDIANSMATVKQTTGQTDATALEGMTRNALLLRDAFGFDVQEQMRAVDMLMKQFGIDSETAFNLVAQGAQNGLNKNGDLLDTINEYSVHYQQLGYDAEQMFNSLANGAAEGTFSVDKLGDAVKEFGIRSKDGSKASLEAFQMLGLNGTTMTAQFAAGGENAEAAMAVVVDRLLRMNDVVKQNSVGVALFGTMFEDLGIEGIAALTNMEGSISSTADALNEINEIQYDSVGSAIEGIKRKLETSLVVPIGQKILPKIDELAVRFDEWLSDPETQASLEELTTSLANFVTNGLEKVLDAAQWFLDNKDAIIAGLTGIAAGFAAFKVAQLITAVSTALQGMSVATALAAAKTWLLNSALLANPIGLAIALVVGLVAALVTLWNKSEAFRNFCTGLWDSIKDGFKNAVKWIGEKIGEIGKFFTETLPETLLSAVSALFQVGYNLIAGLIEGLLSGLSWLWDTITEIGQKVVDWFCDIFDINSPSGVMRDKIGKMLPPGIGIGVEANADSAIQSIRKLGKSLVDNLDVSGISDKLTVIREGFTGGTLKVAAEATPAIVGAGTSKTTNNSKVINYNQTIHSNKPLDSKTIYRQSKNMLSKIVGVDDD